MPQFLGLDIKGRNDCAYIGGHMTSDDISEFYKECINHRFEHLVRFESSTNSTDEELLLVMLRFIEILELPETDRNDSVNYVIELFAQRLPKRDDRL